ncbi:MAG: isochorismatase family protein, partial [Planctomycetales bacterium]
QLDGLEQVLWPDHCIQGTPGAALHEDLNTGRIHYVIQKGKAFQFDSYSGFVDNRHRLATGLGQFLKAHGVTEVAVMGLATDYCVKFTTLDAVALRLETTLIEDGCRGVELNLGDVERAIAEMQAAGVRMVVADQLTRQHQTREIDMIYRKKPVEIEAFPWTSGCELPDWARNKLTEHEGFAHIDTLEGIMAATPGDFIIRGIEGEVYACKPDIFGKTYELVGN